MGGYTQIFHGLLGGCDVWLGVDYTKSRLGLENKSIRTA